METKESFVISGHNYEIAIWTESGVEQWYEVRRDGNMVGVRNPWPIHENTHWRLTITEVVENQKNMQAEQHRRKKAARSE